MAKSIPWSYAPYKPYFYKGDIYISRVVPDVNSVHFEWLSTGSSEYSIYYRKRNEELFVCAGKTALSEYKINGLDTDVDYEFYVESEVGKSLVRLAHTGAAVGTVINYLHPDDKAYSYSGNYLCTPFLLRHPDGYLLASMDVYGVDTPQNLTIIFRSDDDGETWHYVSELMPCFWGHMFIHKGELYMLGMSTEFGDLLIGKSCDGGKTFDAPTVLMRGSGRPTVPGPHRQPLTIVNHKGRIYTTLEWVSWRTEGANSVMVMSCDENADLLDANSWTFTEPLLYSSEWEGTVKGRTTGCIEGSVVLAPDGRLLNIMRYDTEKAEPNYGIILAFEIDTENPAASLKYSHAINFPANLSKFIIKKDEASGYYYTLATRITNPDFVDARNLLSLMRSKDLDNWEVCADILDGRNWEDAEKIGFQYVSFEIEGDDIIFQCRTAVNRPYSYHNTNYSTFHRIKNFRNLKG